MSTLIIFLILSSVAIQLKKENAITATLTLEESLSWMQTILEIAGMLEVSYDCLFMPLRIFRWSRIFVYYCRTDFSQPGHILGSPSERSTQAISERNLSPSSNTLLRVLTHMAMFIGANEHIEVTPFLDF